MCGGFGGPLGIPIPRYLHERLPEETQQAFVTFDAWFNSQEVRSRANMPSEVAQALETIKKTPIPGHEDYTCADSCYVIGVEGKLVE
jgi:hypothetical protein